MQRYDLVNITCCGEPWREMEETDEGDWVLWADVERERNELLARVAELETRKPVVCRTCQVNAIAGRWHCQDCGKDGCGPGVRWA